MTTPQNEEQQPQPAPAQPQRPDPEVLLEQSDTLGKLAGALAKAQGAFTAAKKDTDNPYFETKYADLASIHDVIRKPLSENGLAVVQRPFPRTTGVTVVTDLIHESGEWMRCRVALPLEKRTPQSVGSAITYARRYGLSALVGVAAEADDDGAAASDAPPPQRATARDYTKTPPQKPATETQATRDPAAVAAETARKQLAARTKRLWARAQAEKQLDADGFKRWSITVLGVEKPSTEWTADEVTKLEADFA